MKKYKIAVAGTGYVGLSIAILKTGQTNLLLTMLRQHKR